MIEWPTFPIDSEKNFEGREKGFSIVRIKNRIAHGSSRKAYMVPARVLARYSTVVSGPKFCQATRLGFDSALDHGTIIIFLLFVLTGNGTKMLHTGF
jgi:hypothetical protein